MSQRAQFWLWLLIALAAIARLTTFALLPDQNFPDARAYVQNGESLMATGQMRDWIYMPLYPIWNWLWGGRWGVKIGDIALSAATVLLILRLSLLLFNDSLAGLLAAGAAAIYPHFLFYAVSGLTETAFLFVLVGAFILLYREKYVAAAIAMVASILIRPTIDALAPLLILAFVLVVHRRTLREAIFRLAQYLLVYALLMAPWWAHNYAAYGQFVRLNLGDGVVWLAGNNPGNTSGGGVNLDDGRRDFDFGGFDVYIDPVERNAAMKDTAWRYIKENPEQFAALAATKFARFWRLWPYAPEYERPAIIVVSLATYGSVLILALAWAVREGASRWRRDAPIWLLIGFLTAVHTVTISSIRYRLPLEPFLIVFAARMAAELLRAHGMAKLADRHLNRWHTG